MTTKLRSFLSICYVLVLFLFLSSTAFGQQPGKFENDFKVKLEDFFTGDDIIVQPKKNLGLGASGAMGAMMVPTGYGGSGLNVFGGIGGAFPQNYSNSADLGGAVGVTVGNPVKFVNVALSLNIMDISNFGNYSGNLVISKRLFGGNSISGGINNLFASESISDFAKASYFFVYSHSVQSMPSKTPGSSRLTYSLGIGNGRFYDKSALDIRNGKGKHGTAVFANVSYEFIQNINLNAEWTGLNLGLSVGVRPFKTTPLSVGIGVSNLTSYSSDKSNMMFSLGFPVALMR